MTLSVKAAFEDRFHPFLQSNTSLSNRVWFKTGGAADFLFRAPTLTELQDFLMHCSFPVFPLGVGSNVIIRDGGISGVVIRLGKGFGDISIEGDQIICGAAALDKTVAQYSLSHSLGGIEFLYGIPGTIGGAVRMNAGAYGTEIKDVLQWADVVDRQGILHRLSNKDLGFSYRKCQLDREWIVVRAALQGYPKDSSLIKATMDDIQERRLKTQPQSRTGGSTFANPVKGLHLIKGHSTDHLVKASVEAPKAWELIDAAGCRGLCKGGAQVSVLHCNFLLNTGSATAADLEELGEEVRQRVYQHSGILLEWEIDRVGIK